MWQPEDTKFSVAERLASADLQSPKDENGRWGTASLFSGEG